MAKVDISNLRNKLENDGTTSAGRLGAEEFNQLVSAVENNQTDMVRTITYNGVVLSPNALGDVRIDPISSDTEVRLFTTDNTTSIISIDGTIKIHLRFTSISGGTSTYESGVVTISRFVNGEYNAVGTFSIAASDMSSSLYTEYDISEMLLEGDNRVLVSVKGNQTGLVSNIQFESIIKTTLGIQFAGEYHTPITENNIPLSYRISGTINKTLHIRITGETSLGEPSVRELTYLLGTTTYPITPYTLSITDTENDLCKVLTHGVHIIEAWITGNDNPETLKSEVITNQLMVVRDSSDMKPYLMLQNVKTLVTNYVQTKLAEYAVYNPSGEEVTVAFVIENYGEDLEFMRIEERVTPNTANDLIITVEVDGISNNITQEYFKIYRIDDDVSYNFMDESTGTSRLPINIDNTENFSPTANPDFFINPKVRNNSELHPNRIYNYSRNNDLISSSWSGFGFVNDGWITNEENQKVLRILAGQYLTIHYEPFGDFINRTASSMTLEFDMKVRNVTDEDNPILRVCSTVPSTGKPLGLYMQPLVGKLLTVTKSVESEQDFRWAEDERTHIAINIVHNLLPSTGASSTIPLVRIFINGIINREFQFDINQSNEFIGLDGHGGIRIGQQGADIDIYSIRCYKRAIGASDCQQNYVSSLPSVTAKSAFKWANDLLGNDQTISWAKATEKYNCMCWHGYHTSRHTQSSQNEQQGWLEISILNDDLTKDKEHSGTLCKETASLKDKGQGSTAKTYYEWNQQYDLSKVKKTIMVNGEEVVDGWVDGNGVYRGNTYQIDDSVAPGQKLCLKINYASSMQSHKLGSTRMYNDLYKAIVGRTSIQQTEGFEKTRVTVYQKPFLYFLQEPNATEPVFQGLGTFGPGKMDKKTWGYDKKKFPNFAMFEGADNNKPLTDMRIPFDHKVTYNPEEEYYEYNGEGSLDVDACAMDDNDCPRGPAPEVLKNAWNFLFMHNPRIRPYATGLGNFEAFVDDANVDTSYQYWMTADGESTSKYDCFRYDFSESKWVNAGLYNQSLLTYEKKNLQTLYGSSVTILPTLTPDQVNQLFISALANDAKSHISEYFNVGSLKFHYAFVNMFIAGTDNCSKNTYYVVDPVNLVIELHQDDMDTIFATDNSGYQNKPYYIDRMHDYNQDRTETYYEGSANVLFNLIELMYESSGELAQTMRTMFSEMENLIDSTDQAKGYEKSPWGALDKYFFSVQRYFPAVAFNETARIRYEYPESIGFVSTRNVRPITQSVGDQLQSEMQYMKRRLVLMSSYCAYGEFSINGTGSLGVEASKNPDGTTARLEVTITPHQYLYPTGKVGQSIVNPHVRLAPGETYTLVLGNIDGDTACAVMGANYMRSFGNLGNLSVNPNRSFTISGKRLVEVIADPSDSTPKFRPQAINIYAPLITRLSLNGCTSIGGQLDISNCIRLRTVDVRNTGFSVVRAPETELLTSLRLGGMVEAIELDNVPNLSVLTLDNTSYLRSIKVGANAGSLNVYPIIYTCYTTNANLNVLHVRSANWTNVSSNLFRYMLDVRDLVLQGRIATEEGGIPAMTFDLKLDLIRKFGNVDDATSPNHKGLLVIYNKRPLTSLLVKGPMYTRSVGAYKYTAQPNSVFANDFTDLRWSVDPPSNHLASCSMNEFTGGLYVDSIAISGSDYTTVRVVAYTDSGNVEGSKVIYLYDREAEVGDYVYADGEYSNIYDPTRTVVGICFFVGHPDNGDYAIPDTQRRLCVSARTVRVTGVSDAGNSYNINTFYYGPVYPDYSDPYNQTISFGQIVYENDQFIVRPYTLTLDPSYNVYDTPVSNAPISYGYHTGTEDANMRDLTGAGTRDGFKIPESTSFYSRGISFTGGADDTSHRTLTPELAVLAGEGYEAGQVVNRGYMDTLKLIQHRNKLLQDDTFNLWGDIPTASGNTTELQDFANGLANLYENSPTGVVDFSSNNKNRHTQVYVPVASAAYSYQPSTKPDEELSEKFMAHNWFLPSVGLACRLLWYTKPTNEPQYRIYDSAITNNVIDSFTVSLPTCEEMDSRNCVMLTPSGSEFLVRGYSKGTLLSVRPIAAF